MTKGPLVDFKIRRLGPTDEKAVAEVYGATDTWMGASVSPAFMERNLKYARDEYLLCTDDSKVMLGAFLGGELVMALGVLFWTDMPFCTITRLVGRNTLWAGREVLTCLNQLYDLLFDEMDRRHCSRFYLLSSVEHFRVLVKGGRLNRRLVDNFYLTIEDIVPANTRPKFEYVWRMMGERLWTTTLVLRAGTLRNKSRKLDASVIAPEIIDLLDE